MELFISEAEIEDASMIIDYLNQVGGESDNLTYGLNECYLNEFEEMEVIQDFIDQENSLLLCGFVDDELVSLLSIQGEQKERLKFLENHHDGFAITVKKEYWNMGIASMMMEEALEMIKETPLNILDLEVKEDNLSAINLYKKFNFQEIGRYPRMFNVNQKYYDALLMNLYID